MPPPQLAPRRLGVGLIGLCDGLARPVITWRWRREGSGQRPLPLADRRTRANQLIDHPVLALPHRPLDAAQRVSMIDHWGVTVRILVGLMCPLVPLPDGALWIAGPDERCQSDDAHPRLRIWCGLPAHHANDSLDACGAGMTLHRCGLGRPQMNHGLTAHELTCVTGIATQQLVVVPKPGDESIGKDFSSPYQ